MDDLAELLADAAARKTAAGLLALVLLALATSVALSGRATVKAWIEALWRDRINRQALLAVALVPAVGGGAPLIGGGALYGGGATSVEYERAADGAVRVVIHETKKRGGFTGRATIDPQTGLPVFEVSTEELRAFAGQATTNEAALRALELLDRTLFGAAPGVP